MDNMTAVNQFNADFRRNLVERLTTPPDEMAKIDKKRAKIRRIEQARHELAEKEYAMRFHIKGLEDQRNLVRKLEQE